MNVRNASRLRLLIIFPSSRAHRPSNLLIETTPPHASLAAFFEALVYDRVPLRKTDSSTGCPLSAVTDAPGIEAPFLNWCDMTPNSLLNRKLQLAFGSALLTLLVVGVFSYRSLVVSRESDFWVRHTHEVIERLEDLRAAMQTVESSDRGYL